MHHALFPLCSALSMRLSTLWITSLWQGFAIAAAAALLARAMPRLTARLRYMLWATSYLACVLLPLAECLRSVAGESGVARPAIAVAADIPGLTLGNHWGLLFAWIWAAGACFCLARLLAGLWAVRALLRAATDLPMDACGLAPQQAGSRGQVQILVSHSIATPVATGFCCPAIVLPHALLSELTGEQMAQVLRHELTHLVRRDDWTALITGCIGCLFPLNPALAWIKHRLAETRELACDDAVLEAASPRAYAASLTHIAACRAQRRAPRLLPSLLGERSQLAGRIQHILAPRQRNAHGSRMQLAAAACALALVFGTLVRCPSLIAFAPQQTAPMPMPLARVSSSPTPAAHMQTAPRIAPVLSRVHRRHASIHGGHLLARAPRSFVPSAPEQQNAVLVLWTDQDNGFVTTLVLNLEPAQAEDVHTRLSFSFLEI